MPILKENIAKEARVMTDDARLYWRLDEDFAEHGTVRHTLGEYVSLENPAVHINTVEGYFSIFKRGMRGVYQHCKRRHLHRYLAEFDFRYSSRIAKGIDDSDRADKLLEGVVGKRLTYRTTNSQARGERGCLIVSRKRKEKDETKDGDQYVRFVDAAERIGPYDESILDEAIKKIAKAKPTKNKGKGGRMKKD